MRGYILLGYFTDSIGSDIFNQKTIIGFVTNRSKLVEMTKKKAQKNLSSARVGDQIPDPRRTSALR